MGVWIGLLLWCLTKLFDWLMNHPASVTDRERRKLNEALWQMEQCTAKMKTHGYVAELKEPTDVKDYENMVIKSWPILGDFGEKE